MPSLQATGELEILQPQAEHQNWASISGRPHFLEHLAQVATANTGPQTACISFTFFLLFAAAVDVGSGIGKFGREVVLSLLFANFRNERSLTTLYGSKKERGKNLKVEMSNSRQTPTTPYDSGKIQASKQVICFAGIPYFQRLAPACQQCRDSSIHLHDVLLLTAPSLGSPVLSSQSRLL